MTRRFILPMLALALVACSQQPATQPDEQQPPPDIDTVTYDAPAGALRRLTAEQYANTVRDLLGEDVVVPSRLEQDYNSSGFFSIGARLTTVSPRGAELYEDAAYDLAEQVLLGERARRDALVGCSPSGVEDEACMRDFVTRIGRRAFRRALSDEEVERFTTLGTRAATTLSDFHGGAVYALAGMLQSPKFLFRREVGDLEVDGARAYSDDEMATRLSYFLWNTTPDDALLDAAAAGELTTDEGLRAQVDRMLEDPRARQGVRNFFTELYELYELDSITKAPEAFPQISSEVGPAAREETLRVLEHLIFEERGDYRNILTTPRTFVDRKLAAIYGIPAPAREGFGEAILDEADGRVGLLGHISVLAKNAHPVSSSATLRGIFVRETLLCQPIPDAPADVDTSIPEPSGDALTLRDRVAEHLENTECAGCHNLVDPIGLALENFDGLGSWRDLDNGTPIDTTGVLDGVEFEGPVELAYALREHPKLGSCLTRKLYAYATGHSPERDDQEFIDYLSAHFAYSTYDVLSLMTELAMSPAFRVADDPSAQSAPTTADGQEE